jgi:hypothetical protein
VYGHIGHGSGQGVACSAATIVAVAKRPCVPFILVLGNHGTHRRS